MPAAPLKNANCFNEFRVPEEKANCERAIIPRLFKLFVPSCPAATFSPLAHSWRTANIFVRTNYLICIQVVYVSVLYR